MSDTGHLGIDWRSRPPEEAAHFNPAFCGELIARTVIQYIKTVGRPLPLPLAFLVLPLSLHPSTRHVLPRRATTAFASWAGENADTLSTLPNRVLRLRSVTREALLFMAQLHALQVDGRGISFGASPLRLSKKLRSSTPEVDEIRRRASLLGRWFANQSQPAAILQTMGVRL